MFSITKATRKRVLWLVIWFLTKLIISFRRLLVKNILSSYSAVSVSVYYRFLKQDYLRTLFLNQWIFVWSWVYSEFLSGWIELHHLSTVGIFKLTPHSFFLSKMSISVLVYSLHISHETAAYYHCMIYLRLRIYFYVTL